MKSRSVFEYHQLQSQSTEAAWEPFAPPKRATDAMPGTWERIYEYRRRLEVGRELYHADDRSGVEDD